MLFTTLLLPLAVSANVLYQNEIASAQVANIQIDKLTPKYRKTATRNRYKLGPYTINGSKGGSGKGDSTMGGQAFFYTMPRTLCNSAGPCTILAAQVGVMFADGSVANPSKGIYIHHILTSDTTKKQSPWLSNCGTPGKAATNIAGILGGTAFVGTGEDSADGGAVYTSEDGTRNSGYHVGAQDSFTGWAQLVNYNKENKQIFVFYDLEFVPGIVGDDVKTATFTATCGSGNIKLSQSGPTSTTSGKFTFMEDGKILGARGHLHDGGVKVDLIINDKLACSSEAVYGTRTDSDNMMDSHAHGATGGAAGGKGGAGAKGGAGTGGPSTNIKTISHMSACKGPIPVRKGDSMKLTAVYDLSKHPLRQSASGGKAADVMGMLGVSFAANKQ